jgi:transposase
MGYIEGRDRKQATFWTLEDMLAEESLVRVIDRFVEVIDPSELGFTRSEPASTGRPGYSPRALMKLYVYSYENGVRSSRKLEKEAQRNIEVIWLLEGLTPDHNTIAEFRRVNAASLKRLFREFVLLCKSWGLTDGAVVAQDGSKIRASNSHKNNIKKRTIDQRLAKLDEKIAVHLSKMDEADKDEAEQAAPLDAKALLKLLKRKEKLIECKTQMEETGKEEISLTDPDARMMGSPGKGFGIAHNLQMAVDGKHHIVVDCDVTNNPTDRGELTPMAESLMADGHLSEKSAFLGDKGYYSGEDFMKLAKMGITPIVPKQNPSHIKGQPEMFWFDKFNYDKTTNTYTCPAGHTLYPATPRSDETKRISYYNKSACENCPHNPLCTTGKTKHRVIRRGEYADLCDTIDTAYEQNKTRYALRRELAEHPFGTIKRFMNGSYFLLRTLPKVRGEAALFYLAYNLKRAVNILGFKDIMAKLDAIHPLSASSNSLFPFSSFISGFHSRHHACCA